MKNTTENKSKLFAQYWGQRLICNDNEKDITVGAYGFVNELTVAEQFQSMFKNSCLELKSLSNITDKDAYDIGKLINCWSKSERKQSWFEDDDMKDIHVQGGKFFAESIGKEWGKGLSHPFANSTTDILAAYDTLRSKGYALPFYNCMVEEQVEYGWIKLI